MKLDKTSKLQFFWLICIAGLLYSVVNIGIMFYDYSHFEETCKVLGGTYAQTEEEKVCYKLEKHDVSA